MSYCTQDDSKAAAMSLVHQECDKRPGPHGLWHERVCIWGMACFNAVHTDEGGSPHGMATCDALACIYCRRKHPFQLSVCSCDHAWEKSMYESDSADEVEAEEVEEVEEDE